MSAQSTISSSTKPKDGVIPQLPAQPAKATQPKKRYQYKKDQLAKGDNLLEHLLAIRGIEGEDRGIFLSPDFETNVRDKRHMFIVHSKNYVLLYLFFILFEPLFDRFLKLLFILLFIRDFD